MKKKITFWSSLLLGVMTMISCSNSNDSTEENVSDKGVVSFSVQFSQATARSLGIRAVSAQSKAIPPTSWDNIGSLQFLLYDQSGVVKYSDMITSLPSDIDGKKQFTYSDVPVGTYTLVVVANANSSSISNTIDGGSSLLSWNAYNVRQKNMSNLLLMHKVGEFPSFVKSKELEANNVAYTEPAEIFMGTPASNVVIKSGSISQVPPITISREVSLMRVRLNVKDTESGIINQNVESGVDFSKDASIMIFRLPANMNAKAGNDGGVSTASNAKSILSIYGSDVFKTTDPDASTKYKPTTILSGNFTMWRDLVVFPNNGGRANNSLTTGIANKDSQYFIVVSGKGKAGHVLANGTKLENDTTLYWSGLIKENFVPNVIREVNLTLKSGGDTQVPVTPREEGGLVIELATPQAWDSNIVASEIIL